MKKILQNFNLVPVLFRLPGLFTSRNILGQTKGRIYKPFANALGKSVPIPNYGVFSSITMSGFSITDFGATSKLQLLPLPVSIDKKHYAI